MSLPPGVRRADLEDAVRQWKSAVGAEWVFTSAEDVALYRDAYSPFWGEAEDRVAAAAVAPHSVEEVQAVVRTAHEHGIPLYPISTGRNLGYGGSAPVLSGSVVLDLKRMNRVLEVNENNASALVEPGVNYFDLYRYIQERDLKVWIDPPDPGWGSVMGNALDGGGGWTASPFRDHFGSHCGLEVVLANGELMRTGMGALPNAKSWQQHKWGFGPWVDGLFRQSNMGVVTKMGFWLMPRPQAYLSGTASVYRHRDIIPLIETLNLMENEQVVNGSTNVGNPIAGGFGVRDPDLQALLRRPGGATPEALEALAVAKQIPYWTCTLPIYGPEKVVLAKMEYVRERFAAIPGSTFTQTELLRIPLSPEQLERAHKVDFGVPNLSTFSIGARSAANPNPTDGHVWFSPIVPRNGESILEFQRFYAENLQEITAGENLGFLGPISLTNWERALVMMIMFPISHDPNQNRKIRDAFRRWVRLAAERGWGEYRTAPSFMDEVAETYSFNNGALRRFHETIKDAVDPKGILAAGRYGIWPRHLRKA
ncbi:MAG TPA: FAD-binding oxidoreductase [Steroidobacteraceae bacterium]|nr:FAD-binding oxidoreductase [Steroidobacteraceae bacterium]